MLPKPQECKGCPLYGTGHGFVPASGTGSNGVLIVAEAAGEVEAQNGMPLIGKSGHYLFNALNRIGLDREEFRIHNVLSCRPPENKLAKMPYEAEAISRCSPFLDATIRDMQERCKQTGRTFVILTLGRIAFKRILGIDDRNPILKEDYLAYPFWSEKYRAWVLAADHPSYLMRGNHHLLPILQFVARRAVQIGAEGLHIEPPNYLLDPDPLLFQSWVDAYLNREGNPTAPQAYLSYDIETPHKQGSNEEEIAKEDDDDYTILRCSFAYRPGDAVSVPWRAEYMPSLRRLFAHSGPKVGWNLAYDSPRVRAQMPIHGDELDAMLAWHVLNSALPKGLGFVTPFYWQDCQMWKHLSSVQPAFYNAKDADAALRNWLGIMKDLKENGLWTVFDRHIIQVGRIFNYMSAKGVMLDMDMRAQAEADLSSELDAVEKQIDAVVPIGARELKVYKKAPKSTEGMVEVAEKAMVGRCSHCGHPKPTKPHFKATKKVKNPCSDASVLVAEEMVKRWAKPLPFKISKTSLQRYQKVFRHSPIVDKKTRKIVYDEKAIMRLSKIYPGDKLYPLVLAQRGLVKQLSTYIGVTQEDGRVRGGMPIGPDGAVHTTFSRNPETLRSASSNPNLQNIPHG